MRLKKFLKSEWRKIVIFVVLLVLMNYFSSFGFEGIKPLIKGDERICCFCETATCSGLPFVYSFGGCISEILCYDTTIYWDSLVIDLIFWYLLSCLIVWIYDNFRKVKKK